MVEPRQQQDMILAPNQTMYVLDRTTGEVYAYLGPCKEALATDSRPVVWDGTKFKDVPTFEDAIQQHLVASEEQYIVLRNPTQQTETMKPKRNTAVSLQTGKTVVLRGPTHLALWPGQSAQVIDGHQLDEDQYLKLRVIGPVSDKDA